MVIFLLQDNANVVLHGTIKRITCFSRYIFSFLAYKRLTAIVTLFDSNFSNYLFSDGKSIPTQLYLLVNSLIFVILCGYFFISS